MSEIPMYIAWTIIAAVWGVIVGYWFGTRKIKPYKELAEALARRMEREKQATGSPGMGMADFPASDGWPTETMNDPTLSKAEKVRAAEEWQARQNRPGYSPKEQKMVEMAGHKVPYEKLFSKKEGEQPKDYPSKSRIR